MFSAVQLYTSPPPAITKTNSLGNASTLASFATVLSAAANTASDTTSTSSVTANNIAQFSLWETSYFSKGISEERRTEVKDNAAAFQQLLNKAAAQNAYDDPQSFVASLSTSELATLQHIHCLADPITPSSLSKEGALNLLLSPNQSQDIDNDGYEMIGIGKKYQFPPPNAPDNVKKAWEETTRNMSESNVLQLEITMMPLHIPVSSTTLENNAYIPADADYPALVSQLLEGVKNNSKYDMPWQKDARNAQIAGLEKFLYNLNVT